MLGYDIWYILIKTHDQDPSKALYVWMCVFILYLNLNTAKLGICSMWVIVQEAYPPL